MIYVYVTTHYWLNLSYVKTSKLLTIVTTVQLVIFKGLNFRSLEG